MRLSQGRTILVGAAIVALGITSATAGIAADEDRTVEDAPVADFEARTSNIDAPVEDLESEEVEGDATTIVITSDVLFETGSATLTDAAKDHLGAVADKLKGAAGTINVDGYTDSRGSDSFNQKLSKKRAKAVVAELKKSLPDADFAATGHGEDDPVEPNQKDGKDDPEAMTKNRRVTIEYH